MSRYELLFFQPEKKPHSPSPKRITISVPYIALDLTKTCLLTLGLLFNCPHLSLHLHVEGGEKLYRKQ